MHNKLYQNKSVLTISTKTSRKGGKWLQSQPLVSSLQQTTYDLFRKILEKSRLFP